MLPLLLFAFVFPSVFSLFVSLFVFFSILFRIHNARKASFEMPRLADPLSRPYTEELSASANTDQTIHHQSMDCFPLACHPSAKLLLWGRQGWSRKQLLIGFTDSTSGRRNTANLDFPSGKTAESGIRSTPQRVRPTIRRSLNPSTIHF